MRRSICNDKTQSEYLRQIGVPSHKIQIARLGIDVAHHTHHPIPQSDTIQIVCPVRILPEKKIERIINAIARLSRKDKARIEVHIVGAVLNHIYADKLRIQAYGQPILFHTDIREMKPYIQRSHFIIYPYQYTSYIHRTAMEAMSIGRLVLWYGDTPSDPFLSTAGVTCVGNSDDLRDTIAQLIAQPEELRQKGSDGRNLMEKKCNWKHLWKGYSDIFQDLLSSRSI